MIDLAPIKEVGQAASSDRRVIVTERTGAA